MARSEAQKRADARYEEKRKGARHRGWVWVSYPESVAQGWREMLENEGVPMFVSPLHDRDKNADGTPKKPHNHGLMLWDSPTSYETAKAIADVIGAVMPPKNPKPGAPKPYAQNVRTAARYLCHLDNPDKAQYNPEDVTCINCSLEDYYEVIASSADDDAVTDEMLDYIDEHGIVSYAKFMRICRRKRPEWKRLLYRKNSWLIMEYVKSCYWERVNDLEERERQFEEHVNTMIDNAREKAEIEAGNELLRMMDNYIKHVNGSDSE